MRGLPVYELYQRGYLINFLNEILIEEKKYLESEIVKNNIVFQVMSERILKDIVEEIKIDYEIHPIEGSLCPLDIKKYYQEYYLISNKALNIYINVIGLIGVDFSAASLENKFFKEFEVQNYNKAREIFQNDILKVGTAFRKRTKEIILIYLDRYYRAYEKKYSEGKIEEREIKDLIEEMDFYFENFNKELNITRIDELTVSKNNFKQGEIFQKANSFEEAIECYEKVVSRDVNYLEARYRICMLKENS